MTPLACEQCGYDVTSSEVREGKRFCPECGTWAEGVPPGASFFRTLAGNAVKPSLWILGAGAAWAGTIFAETVFSRHFISIGLVGYPAALASTGVAVVSSAAHVFIKPSVWARAQREPRNRKAWMLQGLTALILGVAAFIALLLTAMAAAYAITEQIKT